jgi:3-oxoacyl-[acyl-carrier protein] reductase
LRPGIMATDMTRAVQDKYDRLISEGLVPERRWGTGEDLGAVVAAVIRGDLPFSTGSIIDVDGGFHLRRL